MNLKHTVKESLTFSKKERIGVFFLLPMILIVAFLPFFPTSPEKQVISSADSAWLIAAGNLQKNTSKESPAYPDSRDEPTGGLEMDHTEGNYNNTPAGVLFNFDPNTLDGAGFKKLGLRDKTTRTLLNYRSKGGKFRKPEDLAKVYGLRPEEFQRLKPYVSIKTAGAMDRYPAENNSYVTPYSADDKPSENRPRYNRVEIEINSADVAGFESLYGIGNKLATKIINFRTRLGGFYSIDQVGETYGVSDSTFQKIKSQLKLDSRLLKKLDINTATYEELSNHPYISGKLAFAILKQKKEKGPFASVEEIKPLAAQTADAYEKLSLYLTIDN